LEIAATIDDGLDMFEKIIGQSKAVNILRNAIVSDKVAQAYIFHGGHGVGKLLTAFSFAKALNCLCDDVERRPCDECKSCAKIEQHNHPDVYLIFPIPNYDMDENGVIKSNTEFEQYRKYIDTKISTPWQDYGFDKVTAIRIEQIRALQRNVAMSRVEGRKKVFIFENFDALTIPAANSFLKTLEEPPADTHFILTVENLSKLMPTILSRCVAVEFYPISAEKIERYLLDVLETEPVKARLYSSLSNGDLSKAITLHYNENLETLDVTVKFLEIVIKRDDLAFLEWIDKYFVKASKNIDVFMSFVQYLYLWLNDLQLITSLPFAATVDENKDTSQPPPNPSNLEGRCLCASHNYFSEIIHQPNTIVFVNQMDLLKEFLAKNPNIFERIPSMLLELDEYLQRLHGNVNQKLILAQIYHSFMKLIPRKALPKEC
jgi:DNA polymerase-3 subunit delta'